MTERTKRILACAAFVLAVALVTARTLAVAGPPAVETDRWALNDFYATVYYPPRALLEGINPYDGASYTAAYPVANFPLYAPLTIALNLPFGVLPRALAGSLYFAMCVGLAVVFAGLILRVTLGRVVGYEVLTLAALVLASRPGQQNAMNGQMTLQVVIGCILALHYAKERPWLAALGVVLATLKPTFGLPLVLLMAVRKDWHALRRGLTLACAGSVLVVVALLARGTGTAELLSSFGADIAWHGEHPNTNLVTTYSRVDCVFLLSRASGWIPSGRTQFALAFACMAVGIWAALRSAGAGVRAASLSSVIGLLTILFFFYHQSYDLLLLFLPATALVTRSGGAWTALGRNARYGLLACFTLPLANFAATDTGRRLMDWDPRVWSAVTLFNAVAVALAFAACCVLAWPRTAPDPLRSEARA